jgi:hypothetical protein
LCAERNPECEGRPGSLACGGLGALATGARRGLIIVYDGGGVLSAPEIGRIVLDDGELAGEYLAVTAIAHRLGGIPWRKASYSGSGGGQCVTR